MRRQWRMAKPITCEEAWQALTAGRCQIVDVREPGEFARKHPRGAINVVFSRKGLADRMETVLAPESAVILLAKEGELEDAIAQVEASRFSLIGVIEGGMAAWAAAGLPVASVREVGIDALPHEGQQYVAQGILDATFLYPTGGAEAIDLALRILGGETVEKKIVLGTRLFTTENVAQGGDIIR